MVAAPLRQPHRRFSKYLGVRKRSWGRWVAEIRVPNSSERLWLGSYSNPYQAARAYDVAATCLRGPAAARNLPDHAVPHPAQHLLTPASIRAFAMHEAACFNFFDEQQHLEPPSAAPLVPTHPPLSPNQSCLQKAPPSSTSDHRVNCSHNDSLDYHLASLTQQLHNPQISSSELRGFQNLVPTELDQNAHLHPQSEISSEPQSAHMQYLDSEEVRRRDQPQNSPTSLLDLWFRLDISSSVHPSLKALLKDSLYPDNSQG